MMLETKQEYTTGQMVRFEATSLYHTATRLQEIMLESQPELDFLGPPAAAGMKSVKMTPDGKFNGINRNRTHYDSLIRALERARREIERRPASRNSRGAWLLLNRCRYHCMTILSMMERNRRSRSEGPEFPVPRRPRQNRRRSEP